MVDEGEKPKVPESPKNESPEKGKDEVVPVSDKRGENLPELPKEVRVMFERLGVQEVIEKTVVAFVEERYAGPLPHPRILAQFDEILPGAAERIFRIFEGQAEHRMHLEKTVVGGDNIRANWGLGLGFTIVFTFGLASLWLIYIGKEVIGLTIFFTEVLGAVGILINRLRGRRRELVETSGKPDKKKGDKKRV